MTYIFPYFPFLAPEKSGVFFYLSVWYDVGKGGGNMENEKTHKVRMFHYGRNCEFVYFTGSFIECLLYASKMFMEQENIYQPEHYEIVKL